MSKKTRSNADSATSTPRAGRDPAHADRQPVGYSRVLAETTSLIQQSRRLALAIVNRELVSLYWRIGQTIVRQQESARWGDAVVVQFAEDLRSAFPDMRGLTQDNLWRMRQFFVSLREVDHWLHSGAPAKLGTAPRELAREKLGTLSREFRTPATAELLSELSWSHHTAILGASDSPAERCFYMQMAVRERWSVRELRRQVASPSPTSPDRRRRKNWGCHLPDRAPRRALDPRTHSATARAVGRGGLMAGHSYELRDKARRLNREFFHDSALGDRLLVDRPELEVNRLSDITPCFIQRIPFRDATGKRRYVDGVSGFLGRFEHDLQSHAHSRVNGATVRVTVRFSLCPTAHFILKLCGEPIERTPGLLQNSADRRLLGIVYP